MPGCTFAHNRSTAAAEYAALLAMEDALSKVDTKAGKAAFSKWRMEHAHSHNNVQPGNYGKPMFHHNFRNVILDMLHMAELNLPKIIWKHAILNHASDDCRAAISELLAEWRHKLDCRRKDDNRQRAQKWFTGEKFSSFCAGTSGSPGGPKALAQIIFMIAEDMQLNGVAAAPVVAAPAAAPAAAAGRGRGRGRAMLTNARKPPPLASAVPVAMVVRLETVHRPTAIELAADPADLAVIRELYGSRAQTLINSLLAWDAFFLWYFHIKTFLDPDSTTSEREAHALENCRRAIDMQEIYERCAIRKHGSYMPHGAVFKTTRDILRVGDVWAYSTSALELQNAETKRVAKSGASSRPQTSSSGQTRSMAGVVSTTIGYATSQCISTLRKLLGASMLRRGDGVIAMPECRRKERLLGVGRTKLTSKVKLEVLQSDYKPRLDSCIKAFVRHLAAQNPPEP